MSDNKDSIGFNMRNKLRYCPRWYAREDGLSSAYNAMICSSTTNMLPVEPGSPLASSGNSTTAVYSDVASKSD